MDTNYFKQKLESERDKLKEKLSFYQKEDPLLNADTRETSYSFDDDTSEEEGHDRIVATNQETADYLKEVEDALERIEKGTYGQCENCGLPIDPERLEVYPAAKLCIKCEEKRA